MKLPHDISRCLGLFDAEAEMQECSKKESCARYMQRASAGPGTPTSWAVCGWRNDGNYQAYIEVQA